MSYQKTYSEIQDFQNNLNNDFLQKLLLDIALPITNIDVANDIVTLTFTRTLTSEEETDLSNIISNYVHKFKLNYYKNKDVPIIAYNKVTSTSFQTVTEYLYSGAYAERIREIAMSCSSDTGLNSYTVRIYDVTHNKSLVERTFTNTDKQIIYIDTFENVPVSISVLEFQFKISKSNKNSSLNIGSIKLYS